MHLLHVSEEGPLTITAALSDRPEVSASVSTTVQLNQTSLADRSGYNSKRHLYPNPSTNYFRLKGVRNSTLLVFDASGRELMRVDQYQEDMAMDISAFSPGIYLIKMEQGSSTEWFKMIKK